MAEFNVGVPNIKGALANNTRASALEKLLSDLPRLLMMREQSKNTADDRIYRSNERQVDRDFAQSQNEYNQYAQQLTHAQREKAMALEQYDVLKAEAKDLGWTMNQHNILPANVRTSGSNDIITMSKDALSKNVKSTQNKITEVNKYITNLTSELSTLKKGMLASKNFETNLIPGLQPGEMNQYKETLSESGLNMINDVHNIDAFKYGASISDPETINRLKLKAERKSLTNITPLSMGVKTDIDSDAHYLSPTYVMGKDIVNNFTNLNQNELLGMIKDPTLSYTDQAPSDFDYSDVENLIESTRKQALELAQDRSATLGLNDKDITSAENYYAGDGGSLTPAYIQYERNYDKNVRLGLNANKNYTLRNRNQITTAAKNELILNKTVNKDVLEAYSKAPEQLRSILIDTSDKDKPEFRVSAKEIAKIAKKNGFNIPKSDISSILSTLSTASTVGLPALLENPNVRIILESYPGGAAFLEEYLNTIMPAQLHTLQGNYTPEKKYGKNDEDQIFNLIDSW